MYFIYILINIYCLSEFMQSIFLPIYYHPFIWLMLPTLLTMVYYLFMFHRRDLFFNLLLHCIRSICSILDIFLYRKSLVCIIKKNLRETNWSTVVLKVFPFLKMYFSYKIFIIQNIGICISYIISDCTTLTLMKSENEYIYYKGLKR